MLAFPLLIWYSIRVLGYWREVDIWLLQGENPLQNSALRWGCSSLPAFFRQLDRVTAPLPSAACFLLTNLIYIGLAMAWGFSISRRILHRNDRRWLLLGCAMAVLWLFLRAVKYRFFSDDAVTRYLWYLYYVPQILSAAVQPVSRRCSWGGARMMRFPAGGICCLFQPYC